MTAPLTVENLQDQAAEVAFPYYQRKARHLIQLAYNQGLDQAAAHYAPDWEQVPAPAPRKRRKTTVTGVTAEAGMAAPADGG